MCICVCAHILYVTCCGVKWSHRQQQLTNLTPTGIHWLFTHPQLHSDTLAHSHHCKCVKKAQHSDLIRQHVCGWEKPGYHFFTEKSMKKKGRKKRERGREGFLCFRTNADYPPKCSSNDSTIKLQQWATQKYATMHKTNRLQRKPPQNWEKHPTATKYQNKTSHLQPLFN